MENATEILMSSPDLEQARKYKKHEKDELMNIPTKNIYYRVQIHTSNVKLEKTVISQRSTPPLRYHVEKNGMGVRSL